MSGSNKIPDMKILENKDEILKMITKESESINVSLCGLNLPEDSVTRIESDIQKLISEETQRAEQEKLNLISKTSSDSTETEILVSLIGLNLPANSVARVESEIKDLLRPHIPKNNNSASQKINEVATCVCASTPVPGKRVGSNFDFTRGPLAEYPLTIGILGDRDALYLTVLDPTNLNINQGEALISFESAPHITFEKQIKSYNLCYGSRTLLTTNGAFHGGQVYQQKIYQGCYGTNTLVFSMAMPVVGMLDVINIDFRRFWYLFSGQRLHFEWTISNYY